MGGTLSLLFIQTVGTRYKATIFDRAVDGVKVRSAGKKKVRIAPSLSR